MMKVKLTNDTIVRYPKDTVIDVADDEARRLIAFNNAIEVKKETKKRASSK